MKVYEVCQSLKEFIFFLVVCACACSLVVFFSINWDVGSEEPHGSDAYHFIVFGFIV